MKKSIYSITTFVFASLFLFCPPVLFPAPITPEQSQEINHQQNEIVINFVVPDSNSEIDKSIQIASNHNKKSITIFHTINTLGKLPITVNN